MAFAPTLFGPISLVPRRTPQQRSLEERRRDYEEAAMFATLGGKVPSELFDPPFELLGYRLLVNTKPSYVVQNDNQNAPAGNLNKPIQVVIKDAGGAPVEGVPVVFEIQDGGGTVNGDTARADATTDRRGVASVTWSIAGAATTKNTVRAWAHGFDHTFTATVA